LLTDRYLQEDGKTLKNKLGIVLDPETLAMKEAAIVFTRSLELYANGFPRAKGFESVKAIHRYLFQDIYEWAGEPRTIDLARKAYADGSADLQRFTKAAHIEREGCRLFNDLSAANHLRGLTREQFANKLTPFFGRLNQLHPFREGNGRTQRLVWEQVAQHAGHELSFEGISRERMVAVSIAGGAGDHQPAQRMFAELLDPQRSQALRTATRFLEAHRTPAINWQDRYVATTQPGQAYAGTFVSTDGTHFMMHDGKSIYIGTRADLPEEGRAVRRGDPVSFRAGEPTMSRAQLFRARTDQVAARVTAEHRQERAASASKEPARDLDQTQKHGRRNRGRDGGRER
jgi:cell filamentation protein